MHVACVNGPVEFLIFSFFRIQVKRRWMVLILLFFCARRTTRCFAFHFSSFGYGRAIAGRFATSFQRFVKFCKKGIQILKH